MVLPELAKHLGILTSPSGTWLEDLSYQLSQDKNIELYIAAISGNKYCDYQIRNIRYLLLPGTGKQMLFYTNSYRKYWRKINADISPDIVHLHGTEYSHGLSYLRELPETKAIVSIQGLLTRVKDVDLAGLSLMDILKYRTITEYLRFNGILEQHLLLKFNYRYEQEIIKRVKYANTVNFWDTSIVKSINPAIQCFTQQYNLREAFYRSPKWDIKTIDKNTLFTTPGETPLKGLHILLMAISIVRQYYPSVKVIVPGYAMEKGKLIKKSGYSKYIAYLLNKYDLSENIEFVGRLSESQIVELMLKSHTVIVPSAIEGTSLILREAMFLGVPCIAAFRGGMADFIRDKESGFLYDFHEYEYLAYRIMQLFENDQLACKFSNNGIYAAETAHSRQANVSSYISMYKTIYCKQ